MSENTEREPTYECHVRVGASMDSKGKCKPDVKCEINRLNQPEGDDMYDNIHADVERAIYETTYAIKALLEEFGE
jgi:hypothetical protein